MIERWATREGADTITDILAASIVIIPILIIVSVCVIPVAIIASTTLYLKRVGPYYRRLQLRLENWFKKKVDFAELLLISH